MRLHPEIWIKDSSLKKINKYKRQLDVVISGAVLTVTTIPTVLTASFSLWRSQTNQNKNIKQNKLESGGGGVPWRCRRGSVWFAAANREAGGCAQLNGFLRHTLSSAAGTKAVVHSPSSSSSSSRHHCTIRLGKIHQLSADSFIDVKDKGWANGVTKV